MPHPQRAEVGLIAAIIATIQLILIASVAHEVATRPRALAEPLPSATLLLDRAEATIAPGR